MKGIRLSTQNGNAVASLKDRQGELTRRLIVEAGIAHLEDGAVGELTVRAIAQRANLAERTVFRYFASRDELLDALAEEVRARLALPPLPASAEQLVDAPRALYRGFEAQPELTKAALHTELFDRIRESSARDRWKAVKELIDAYAPQRPERDRALAAASIRYLLSATTWHYFRVYFGLSLRDTIACSERSIRQALDALSKGPPTDGNA